MSEHQSRQVDYGSANDGLLDGEAPDLGPLQEAAEAAELAEATSGLTDSFGGPLPAEDPLRPLAYAVARALTEAGFTLHHCARHHPRYRLGGASGPPQAPKGPTRPMRNAYAVKRDPRLSWEVSSTRPATSARPDACHLIERAHARPWVRCSVQIGHSGRARRAGAHRQADWARRWLVCGRTGWSELV